MIWVCFVTEAVLLPSTAEKGLVTFQIQQSWWHYLEL